VKICYAPRYQGRLAFAERVQVVCSTGWRAARADELATMYADDGNVSIIGIPRHLLKRWWGLVETDDVTTGFEGFGRELAEYFAYKNWRLPATPLMEVVASDWPRDRALVPSNPMRFANGVGTLIACINLGDENAAIALKAELGRIRVILEPGEGLLMPSAGVLFNRSTLGNSDLAVTLLIAELAPQ
jgi:hypothetical protein